MVFIYQKWAFSPKSVMDVIGQSLRYAEACCSILNQGCGAGTGTGRNRIHLGSPALEPEPYSEYGSGSGYKEMKQKTQKNLLKF
jgi:hypothetical protein